MSLHIISATMKHTEESGYVGCVQFQLDEYRSTYEITFFSKKGREWDYSLNFAKEPGSEEEMMAVDARIEEDDELFEQFLEAAEKQLDQQS